MSAPLEQLQTRLTRYQGFLQQDPSNASLAQEVAELQLRLGQLAEARQILETALASHPGHGALLGALASVAIASNQPDEAIGILQGLQKAGQDHPVVHYNLAYALMLARRFDEAREVLLPIVADPQAPEAPVLLARCLHHLGELDDAIARLTDFVAQHPGHAEALGQLSLLQLDASNGPAALAAAEQSLAANPEDLGALVTMGSLALETQDQSTATGFFEHALANNPRSGRAWSGLGLATMLELDLPKAIEQLRHAVEHMPSHIGTWHALAWCQILAQDLDGALHSFEQSLEIDRSFGETHGGLAVIAVMQNRLAEADQSIKRALRLDPNSFAGRFAQSLVANKSDPERSQQMLQNILSSSIVPGGEPLSEILKRNITRRGPIAPRKH